MSYVTYKLIHFIGIFTLITAIAVAAAHTLRGGNKADNPHRKPIAIAHGIAVFLILLGGFGMLARLGIIQAGLPGWILLKLGIWLLLAASIALVYRGREVARALVWAVPLLALAAAASALVKPF
jgi:hypothetical protein